MNDHTPNTVGVDISKTHLDAHRLPNGEAARFTNNAAGIEALARWAGASVGRVVYESTGPYHRALEEALVDRLPLARVNAARARRFAQALGQSAKTDAVDAAVLAKMGEALKPRLVKARSQAQRGLDELHTARNALVRDRTAALNRQKHARHPLIRRQLNNRRAQAERQIRAIDAEMAQLIAKDAQLVRRTEVLASVPGIGLVTARGLLAEMPELGTVEGKAVASLAGLAPVTRESGAWRGRSFIHGGRAGARRLLYMASVTAVRHNPDLARKYQELRARGKPPKVALTAVMRKLLLLANALLGKDRLWTPSPAGAVG